MTNGQGCFQELTSWEGFGAMEPLVSYRYMIEIRERKVFGWNFIFRHLLWAICPSVLAGDSPAYDKFYYYILSCLNSTIYPVIWTVKLKHWTAAVSIGSFIPGYMCILVIYSIFTWSVCDMPYNLYTKECITREALPLSMLSEFLSTRVTSLLLD